MHVSSCRCQMMYPYSGTVGDSVAAHDRAASIA
jgi:hypothetical protein